MATRTSKAVLLLAWMAALGGLIIMSVIFSGESTQFPGIADDQEQTIRFSSPVEIVNYGFVSGQEVNAGDLIVEVRQPELDAELQVILERIQALKFGNREARASMQSQILQLQADLQAKMTELDSQIRSLKAREIATQNFLDGLSRENNGDRSTIQREIDSLQERKQALRRATAAQTNDLHSRLGTPERPVDAQIAELENRQQEIQRQQSELQVFAQLAGRVGSVLFKIGERVPPYQPVLTVHGSRPSFIKGYIHENVLNSARLNQTVWVQSSNSLHTTQWYPGIVESLGSRIVEFPERLKVNPMVQAWGREVVVRLHGEHTLLLGEKVSVQLERPVSRLSDVKTLLVESLQ